MSQFKIYALSICANINELFKYLASISSMDILVQTFNLYINILSIIIDNGQ